jgi:hypothetical protein
VKDLTISEEAASLELSKHMDTTEKVFEALSRLRDQGLFAVLEGAEIEDLMAFAAYFSSAILTTSPEKAELYFEMVRASREFYIGLAETAKEQGTPLSGKSVVVPTFNTTTPYNGVVI